MANEHDVLVNTLANTLESQKGITIVEIDTGDSKKRFARKYHDLPKPEERGGRIPDLVGRDADGTIHLGEAETDMDAENLDDQLRVFSNRVMTHSKIPVSLHVIVPQRISQDMEDRIRELGLGQKLEDERIIIWYTTD